MMMGGCRISQQLLEYNPCQFVTCRSCLHGTAPPPPRFRSSSRRFLGFKLSGSNDDGLAISNEASQPHLFSPAKSGGDLPSERVSVAGGIVALGKFDALHIGHRELAIQAAKIGVPYLMSFVGMGEVLGWEPRAPIVARCDRKRVLSSWAPFCGNVTPKEYEVEFSQVRYLTPQQFVERLAVDLGIHGVVAGENYRFGYKAAGNSSDLVRLCDEYGMKACIIKTVMDKHQYSTDVGSNSGSSQERGQVSSTRVRQALGNGDMRYVSELLGRHHRLMLMIRNSENIFSDRKRLSVKYRPCLLNLPPKEGVYENCSLVVGDESPVICRVTIDSTCIHLELDEQEVAHHMNSSAQNLLLGIDFGESKL
ncbi:FAD synthetase 1, chloroplastic [Salvia hispanica]|uniref:FAD synthetase 1, chloroplastic n=1 Tax=Salvia hispanica TaxID=49212 RepID=UPI00200921EA|nr:FAD synthetase 1, chloroplastic [Salvia hispanica]